MVCFGMVTRREWLDAGLELLADEGAPAVTIERLTGKLGVTKGSYYHHFKGPPATGRRSWSTSRCSSPPG